MLEEATQQTEGLAAVHDIAEARDFVNKTKRNRVLWGIGGTIAVVTAVVIADAVTPPVITPLSGKLAPNATSRQLADEFRANRKKLRQDNKDRRTAAKAKAEADKHIQNNGGEQASSEE